MDQVKEAMDYARNLTTSLHHDYVAWIKRNPNRASEIESSVKIVAYLIHGRLKSRSTILPELLYCSSNLITFWHDSLLKAEADRLTSAKSTTSHSVLPRNGYRKGVIPSNSTEDSAGEEGKLVHRIKSLLTILEYFEFFLEVSARQLWGDFGRWVVIFVTQAVKACLRTVLLCRFKVGMIESPALQPYDRKSLHSARPSASVPSVAFVLKHSGRVVRKIHASPPMSSRNWKVPSVSSSVTFPRDLPPLRLLAEILHILRPLSHLVSLGVWGTMSWKPWMVSLVMDISSLHLHGPTQGLRTREKLELTRRTYALLFYLIRSPFYDRYTKRRLLNSLRYFDRIPVVGGICKILADAIPDWQDTYSYVWNDV